MGGRWFSRRLVPLVLSINAASASSSAGVRRLGAVQRASLAGFVPALPRPLRAATKAVCWRAMSVSGGVYEGPSGAPVVTLYTKAECTLCDKVKEVLKTVAADAPHSLVQVDITDEGNAEWWDRYKYDIPVLHVNDQYWLKHRTTPEEAITGLAEASSGTFKSPPGQPDASRLERT